MPGPPPIIRDIALASPPPSTGGVLGAGHAPAVAGGDPPIVIDIVRADPPDDPQGVGLHAEGWIFT